MDAPQDQSAPQELLDENLFSHQGEVEEDGAYRYEIEIDQSPCDPDSVNPHIPERVSHNP